MILKRLSSLALNLFKKILVYTEFFLYKLFYLEIILILIYSNLFQIFEFIILYSNNLNKIWFFKLKIISRS